MKNKIAVKLTLVLAAVLLLFSLLIGGVFANLFREHTIRLQQTELKQRAETMASALSGIMTGNNPGMAGMRGGGMGGYGVYLRFLDEIAMTDVWLVDEDLSLITVGPMSYPPYSYADLPANAEAVVKAAFQGNTTFGTGFSELLQTPTLTVGAPIRAGEAVLGVLLLHSPVEGMNAAIDQGLGLLFGSLGAALALSIPLSLALAAAADARHCGTADAGGLHRQDRSRAKG